MLEQDNSKTYLKYCLILGFVLRILFLLVGASFYYGSDIHTTGDSFSYTLSFINFYEQGSYSFDLSNPDAAFGRFPLYPFFWGLHYVIFGPTWVYLAVSISQILLDCLSIYFIYSISIALFKHKNIALLNALIYSCYPFIIVWTTISGTELFGNFISLAALYFIFKPFSFRNMLWASLFVVGAFYTRPYLAILMCPIIIRIWQEKLDWFSFFKQSALVSIVFFSLYSLWPIRNYYHHHQVVLLKGKTPGYERYSMDIHSCRAWLMAWTTEVDFHITNLSNNDISHIPEKVLIDQEGKALLDKALALSLDCGVGFYNWRFNKKYPKASNCDDEVNELFTQLLEKYKKAYPLKYQTEVPLLNLQKAFFKNTVSKEGSGAKTIMISLLFFFRTVLLILAMIGIILLYKHLSTWILAFFSIFMYLFICIILRQLEMRYLIQADTILLVFSGYTLYILGEKLFGIIRPKSSS